MNDAFHMEADIDRNVFRTHFRNVISGATMKARIEDSEALLAQMKQGFTVVADLTELERMDIDCVPHVTQLMDQFLAAGVGQVIRVIPDRDKDIGFTLLSLTHYRGKVPIRTCESREEAELALAS